MGNLQEIGMTVEARPTQQQQETGQSQQERPTLGINAINITEQIAARMNLTGLQQQPQQREFSGNDLVGQQGGVLVVDVFADGPAERAGLRGGFIVADIDGTPIEIGGDVIMRIDDTMIPNVEALDEFIEK